MRLLVIAVGKTRATGYKTLWQDYASRLRPPPELIEIDERGAFPPAEKMRREADAIAAVMQSKAVTIALDRNGSVQTSEEFAGKLSDWRESGAAAIQFIIGGADGLANDLLTRAQFRLSLGKMTWPHQLARIMLVEQLYRADTLRIGHPYHR